MIQVSLLAIIISFVALAYAGYLSFKIMKIGPGNEKMKEISNAISEGAMAYMARQYKTIAVFAIIIFLVLLALFETPIALGFLLGAVLSGISGYIGMSISVRANSRTAETAKIGRA